MPDEQSQKVPSKFEQIMAGAEVNAGDGGYEIGTREAYEAFVKKRNASLGMPPLVKQLAERAAHQSQDGYPVIIPYNNDFAREFAKLIVEECAAVQFERSTQRHGYDKHEDAQAIKDHFLPDPQPPAATSGSAQQEPQPEVSQPPKFPTMLRKMWSGSDVQQWINNHWNKSKK